MHLPGAMSDTKRETLVLYNDFHGTESRVRVTWRGSAARITRRTVSRIESELCGVEGCTCGDYGLGLRPMSQMAVQPYCDGSIEFQRG
jgi:hypothetical protein